MRDGIRRRFLSIMFICLAVFSAVLSWSPALWAEVTYERGALERGDETLDADQFADSYQVEVEEGQRIRVVLTSQDFDTYLYVMPPSQGTLENDDAGSTEISMVSVALTEAGTYDVIASSFGSGETGEYQLLIVTEESNARVEQGRLSGKGARSFAFSGAEGQQVTATVTSDDFDTVLRLLGGDEVLAENDDYADTNSQINFSLPTEGEYELEVDSFGGGEEGEFELTIDIREPADFLEEGELTEDDPTLPSGEFSDTYEVELAEGELLEVNVYSDSFDTYLIVDGPGGEQWENDDFSGTNSGLIAFVETAGTYRVTVTTFTSGETGQYQVLIDHTGGEEEGNGRPPKP